MDPLDAMLYRLQLEHAEKIDNDRLKQVKSSKKALDDDGCEVSRHDWEDFEDDDDCEATRYVWDDPEDDDFDDDDNYDDDDEDDEYDDDDDYDD